MIEGADERTKKTQEIGNQTQIEFSGITWKEGERPRQEVKGRRQR